MCEQRADPGRDVHVARFLQTIVYSRPLDDQQASTYVAQSDFGYQNDATGQRQRRLVVRLEPVLVLQGQRLLDLGLRGEWFRDEEGFRVGGFLGDHAQRRDRGLDTATRSAIAGSFYEVTFGANCKYSRRTSTFGPYVRFDWFSGRSSAADEPACPSTTVSATARRCWASTW